jgi:hypothetical protein
VTVAGYSGTPDAECISHGFGLSGTFDTLKPDGDQVFVIN